MQAVVMVGIWLLVGLLTGGVDLLLRRPKSVWNGIATVLLDIAVVNLVTLLTIRFIRHRAYIFEPAAYYGRFDVRYIVFALLFGVAFAFFKAFAYGELKLEKEKFHFTPLTITITVVAIILAVVGTVIWCAAWWFNSFFGGMTPEQMIYNFFSPVTGAVGDGITDVVTRPVFLAVSIIFVLLLIMFMPLALSKQGRIVLHNKVVKIAAWVVSVLLLIGGTTYAYTTVHLDKIIKAYTVKSEFIANNYVNPATARLQYPEKQRNLIHIYFESFENSYLDKAHGGYMEHNLIPDMMKLSEEKDAVHFSNRSTWGGPHQTYGSSWSVAGMVNMTFGIPMKVPTDGNSYGLQGNFMPGATGTIDLLAKRGYNQTVMFGADADFGGLTTMFTEHGHLKIFDWKYAKAQHLIPENYKVWWGFEDNKLYNYAKEEITRLSTLGKPFHFVMENADTHFPDGYLEPETQRLFGNQYADVIFHSQKQVYDFIRWIQAQPFYKNTTIVVTGDHLSMDPNFFKNWDPHYERTTYNLFLNPAFTNKDFKTHNRQYAPFDYMPTIVNSLGIKIPGERLGLGTNLASSHKTLIEKDGLAHVDEELSYYSKFYATNILEMKNAPHDASGRTVHSAE